MKRFSVSPVLLALIAALLLLAPLPAEPAQLRVGQAAVKITPPAGMPMAGYYHVRLSEGVHDELHAKAIVIEQGGTKAALVACDLISVPIALVKQVRQVVQSATGIPPDHVMISATHAHTGPVMTATPRGADAQAAAVARAYHEELPNRIAESVKLAAGSLQPATASAAIGHADSISFVRRFLMKDGSIGWNPGKLNPDIIRPVSTIDPAVPFVYFETMDSDPLAVFVNFANHLDTVGGMDFSADYPYMLAQVLAKVNGPDLLTMFTVGTCGNINHLDVSHNGRQKGHGEAARIGSVLAASVIDEFPNLETIAPAAIRASRATVSLPVLRVTPAEVDAAAEVMESYGKPGARPFYEQVHAAKVLAAAKLDGKPIQAEVQVITLGNDVAWVALPGEVFVELGKAIKLASPFRYTIVSELSNDAVVDYIPDRKAYSQGAYEAMSTPVAPGGGELLVETAVRLLIETREPYPIAHR
jgi:neutral/alkaline ceramidase-like enzyme